MNSHFIEIRSRRIEVWFPKPETPTPENVVFNHHSMILCLFTSLDLLLKTDILLDNGEEGFCG